MPVLCAIGVTFHVASVERSYRLLIVDDDAAVDRRLYSRLLTRLVPDVFDIVQTCDGATGLAALRTHRPDCVLLDFDLPDMTGFEFLDDAASGGDLPCAVVLIAGQGSEAIAVDAMKLGVQDYLARTRKPRAACGAR
jgi:CheY-like chemotaxis protein